MHRKKGERVFAFLIVITIGTIWPIHSFADDPIIGVAKRIGAIESELQKVSREISKVNLAIARASKGASEDSSLGGSLYGSVSSAQSFLMGTGGMLDLREELGSGCIKQGLADNKYFGRLAGADMMMDMYIKFVQDEGRDIADKNLRGLADKAELLLREAKMQFRVALKEGLKCMPRPKAAD